MNGKLLRLVDRYLGTLLYLLLAALPRMHGQDNNKVLAIKLWALGETVLVLPAVKALSDKGYSVSILVTKNNKDIVSGIGFLDEVISFDPKSPLDLIKTIAYIRRKKYGITVDFEPYTRFSSILSYLSGAGRRIGFGNRPLLYTETMLPDEDIHAVINFVNLSRLLCRAETPKNLVRLHAGSASEAWVKKFLAENKIKKNDLLIGMHAGSGASSIARRWPEDRFALLCRKLEKYNAKIVLVGNETELNERIHSMAGNTINAGGKMGVKKLIAFAGRCRLFIANDSGLMHIAAAMGTPTIGLFGPNTPQRYGPFGSRCTGIYKGRGVAFIRPFRGVFPEKFREDYVKNITVEDVLKASEKLGFG